MKKRSKRSIIWKIEKSEMEKIVAKSSTFKDILRHFNLINKGANSNTLKSRLIEESIDFSHITTGWGHNKGKSFCKKARPLNEYMIENSTYNRSSLKRRLIQENILANKCSICGLDAEWNNKKLVIILDHINGVFNDNRLENLRLVCPNCNSQLETFAGKNFIRPKNPKRYCICGKRKSPASDLCYGCYSKSEKRFKKDIKNRPTREQLEKDILGMPVITIGGKYGVSDNSIRKWAKSYGIHIVGKREFRENITNTVCDEFKNTKISMTALSKKYKTTLHVIKDILFKAGLVEKIIPKTYKHGYQGVYYDNSRRHYVCFADNQDNRFFKRGFETAEQAAKYRETLLRGKDYELSVNNLIPSENGLKVTG